MPPGGSSWWRLRAAAGRTTPAARARGRLLSFLDSSPPCLRGTDLVLPPSSNGELRDVLLAKETMRTASSNEWSNDDELVVERLSEIDDASAPEVSGAGWWCAWVPMSNM